MNLVNGSQSNSEIDYLVELINDFPTEKQINAQIALKILAVRYEELEKNTAGFLKTIINPPQRLLKYPFNKLIIGNDYFPEIKSFLEPALSDKKNKIWNFQEWRWKDI